MSISPNFDIYNSLFNFNTNSFSIKNPQFDFIIKGIVASKYTNSINEQLSSEISSFMSAFNKQISEMGSTMDSLVNYEEKDVYSFKDNFNDFKSFLNDNSENTQVNLINKQVDNLVNEFEEDLSSIGISKGYKGLLEIDGDKFAEVSEEYPEEIEKVFNNNSFADRLRSRIQTVSKLPEPLFIEDKIVKNSSVTKNNFYNYFNNGQKSNLTLNQSQGSLIDITF